MNENIRLGEIAGVRVGINWSVLAIFLLITFGLAAGRFPLVFPDQSVPVYIAAGLVAAVLFFLSLLAHEISHAVVARRNGLHVDGITLWLFGGVARLGGEADDPGAEFRIAGVGPLVSVLLGVLFAIVVGLVDFIGLPGIAVDIFVWLATINVVLAVFNLVPAAPLDGGRILRAFLWKRRGDRFSAGVTAARAGKGFGFVLIALGLLQFVALPGFAGLWLVLIGWFLVNAASAEEQHAKVSSRLGDVRVADVMSADPVTAPRDISVEDFLEDYAMRQRFSSFPLTDASGRLGGLITLNRVKQVPRDERATTSVADVACPAGDVPTARPDEPLADVLPRLADCTDGRALVLEDDRIVGIVSPTDIARHLELSELRGVEDPSHA